ncbi:hypothetical protein VSP20_03250 [Myroides phaeus]|uniref:hypothetical protein n=1 Tax=Myroides phaeus TaxID=702745 RepID=UPI002DB9F279|nr:hypothetical protein [Myroides phaeus]MEC4115978.1 hypothetical protein [Myroides phaeus]
MKKLDVICKNRIVLNGMYFFRTDAITRGQPVQINRVKDFVQYNVLCEKGVDNLSTEERHLLRQVLSDNEEVFLKEGSYLVDTLTNYWEFNVDSKNRIVGNSYFNDIVDDMKYWLIFEEGIAVKGKLTINNVVVSTFHYNNEILCLRYFGENDLLLSQTEIFVNLLNEDNVICTSYYKNGEVMRIENSIDQSIITYYETGNLESVQNLSEQWSKFYNENGLICSEMYYLDDVKTIITYSKGIITKKIEVSEEENKNYYFKNGVLSSFEVCNNATNEVTIY